MKNILFNLGAYLTKSWSRCLVLPFKVKIRVLFFCSSRTSTKMAKFLLLFLLDNHTNCCSCRLWSWYKESVFILQAVKEKAKLVHNDLVQLNCRPLSTMQMSYVPLDRLYCLGLWCGYEVYSHETPPPRLVLQHHPAHAGSSCTWSGLYWLVPPIIQATNQSWCLLKLKR